MPSPMFILTSVLYLRWLRYKVTYVQNPTDIDDDIRSSGFPTIAYLLETGRWLEFAESACQSSLFSVSQRAGYHRRCR